MKEIEIKNPLFELHPFEADKEFQFVGHTFRECLDYEHSKFADADAFIKEIYGREPERMSWEDSAGKKSQKKDIDLVIGNIKISEKFRRTWYDDVSVEIYSDIKKKTPGSQLKSESNFHHYYYEESGTIEEVRIIPTLKMKNMIVHLQTVFQEELDDFIESGERHKFFLYKGMMFNAYKIRTYAGENSWDGLIWCLPFEIFEHFEVPIKFYRQCSIQGKKLWQKV